MTRREYKSGTRWCLWRWKTVDTGYITRLHIIQTPFGMIGLHWINAPDPERDLHDHPVNFWSIRLRGWYNEHVRDGRGEYRRTNRWSRFTYIPATHIHKITAVSPGGCLTLCLMSRKRREWGFHTPPGWVHWKRYNKTLAVSAPGLRPPMPSMYTDGLGPPPPFDKEWQP